MFFTRRLTVLCKHLKQNLQRNLTTEAPVVTNVSISKPEEERTVLVEVDNQVMTIGINRPSKKNSLDFSTAQYLSEALDTFEANQEVKVGILYGTNGNFCAGYDLHEIAKHNEKSDNLLPQFSSLSSRDSLIKKPLIAAVEGFAIDVGLELALMCDLRLIDETASLGFLNRRFGIPIMSGGTVRLPKLIGYSRAMDMILTGRLINATEAFQFGLANRVVNCGCAVGESAVLASKLTFHPQEALLADRLSAHHATFSAIHIDEALQFEKDCASNPLFNEGVRDAKKFSEEGIGKHGKIVNFYKREEVKDIRDDLL
ncbi:probable enoyl-CoA hydratase [Leptopilina heterotoma]|uniref:probable enoyl-CoA hydratase n=1 Tax=Leptopilina heterotoma TaxID=63436 RepID=UPI001CA924C6|nr:probable enoyl-CoA hydratase [Leptopilina heterotoma]